MKNILNIFLVGIILSLTGFLGYQLKPQTVIIETEKLGGFAPISVPAGGTGMSSTSANSILVSGPTATSSLRATSSNPLYIGSLVATTTATSTFAGGINATSGCFSINGTCVGGSTGITSLNGLTGGTQTFSSNQLLSITSSGTEHQLFASTSPNFSNARATGTLDVEGLSRLAGLISSASSTIAGNLSISGVLRASSTATSTMQGGFNIVTGCFSVKGICLTPDTDTGITSLNSLTGATQTFASGNGLLVISSAGTEHLFNASTSPYFGNVTATGTIAFTSLSSGLLGNNSGTLYGGIATGTVSGTNGITVTASRSAIGGALAIDCTASGSGSTGCLSSTDWNIFNNKSSFAYLFPANSTSTLLNFTGGIISSASSTIAGDLRVSGTLKASTTKKIILPNTFIATGTIVDFLDPVDIPATVTRVRAKAICSGSPCSGNVVFSLRHATDMTASTTATSLFSAAEPTTSSSTYRTITSFNDNTLTAGEMLWIHIEQASSTPNTGAVISVDYNYD